MTGIEMLEEIVKRLTILEQKIDVMDRNVKIILNNAKKDMPVAKLTSVDAKQTTNVAKEVSANQTGFKHFKLETSDAATMHSGEMLAQKQRTPVSKNTIVTKGKMVIELDGKLVPLADVSVKIFNDTDVLIKETKTNRAGQWTSFLPAGGKFVALFEGTVNGKKLTPINRNFVLPDALPEGIKEFSVE